MAKGIKALITPSVLKWARENSGFANNIEVVAEKLGQKPETIELWEKGEKLPTFKQLMKIANVYKRPIALFYREEPPENFKPIEDYRRLPDATPLSESPQLHYEIRKARYRRESAIELFEELGEEPPKFNQKITLLDNPEEIGEKIRSWLKVDKEIQTKWKDAREVFNGWRQVLESFGILVFQTGGVDSPKGVEVSEMRGFAISDRPLPVIVVNSKDSFKGRIFSLLHELAHILLGDSGISGGIIDDEMSETMMLKTAKLKLNDKKKKIEIFCNHVAAATLLSSDWFQEDELLLSYGNNWSDKSDEAVEKVAQRFKVSREFIWRRLSTLEFVNKSVYDKKRQELLDKSKQYDIESSRTKKIEKEGGFAPPHNRIISTIGKPYAELVLSNYYEGNINYSDVSDYLDMNLKHLPNIEKAIFGVSYST